MGLLEVAGRLVLGLFILHLLEFFRVLYRFGQILNRLGDSLVEPPLENEEEHHEDYDVHAQAKKLEPCEITGHESPQVVLDGDLQGVLLTTDHIHLVCPVVELMDSVGVQRARLLPGVVLSVIFHHDLLDVYLPLLLASRRRPVGLRLPFAVSLLLLD